MKARTYKISADELPTSATDNGSDISVTLSHTYPDDFGMADLSPSEYAALAERINTNEIQALNHVKISSMNDDNIKEKTECDEDCRKEIACGLNYSINEYTILCRGYDFSYADSFHYLMGAISNPWSSHP